MGDELDKLTDDLMELTLEPVMAVLEEINELPCSVCRETGDTLPCLICDKLICGECGEGIRWCKEHRPVVE